MFVLIYSLDLVSIFYHLKSQDGQYLRPGFICTFWCYTSRLETSLGVFWSFDPVIGAEVIVIIMVRALCAVCSLETREKNGDRQRCKLQSNSEIDRRKSPLAKGNNKQHVALRFIFCFIGFV